MEIPAEAMPVVLILRREVPRPTAPLSVATFSTRNGPQFPRFACGKCPLGLLPYAAGPMPGARGFPKTSPLFNSDATIAFLNWWDFLTLDQAREAVDLIWAPTASSALEQ